MLNAELKARSTVARPSSNQHSVINDQNLQNSQSASLQRVRDGLGRFRIRGLRPIAPVVNVGDADLARVERIDGHAAHPGKELDTGIEFRGAVAPVRDDVEQRCLLLWCRTGEVGGAS